MRYSVIVFVFTFFIVTGVAFEKIFQAVGRMKVTMISLMCGCILNIVLDPVLIFGLGPFPEMGIEGAALATGLGQASSLLFYLVTYFVSPIRVRIGRKYLVPDKKIIFRLYSVGIGYFESCLPSILISASEWNSVFFSQVYILVLGIYYKLQTFCICRQTGLFRACGLLWALTMARANTDG